tara:strand:- start:198 stop:797 length:600 start_codon:yes stop_codon:yes gene_type:complete
MSSIKLKHSGGNGVIIAAPSSNPASDRTITVPSNADGTMLTTTNPKAGNIIQVVTATKEDTAMYYGTSYADISGLTATINGVSSGSKIIINLNIMAGYNCNAQLFFFKLFRDSTFLPAYSGATDTFHSTEYSAGTNYNDMMYDLSYSFIDTHGQSAGSNLVYKVQGMSNSSGCSTFINRFPNSSNVRGQSRITLLEVAA